MATPRPRKRARSRSATARPTSTPHDGLFQFTFGDVEHAAPALRTMLPPTLAAQVDFSTLRRERGHFVDPELRERRSDLLFSAVAGGRRILFYLLFEHQSSVDKLLLLRLLEYMTRIWRAHLERHRKAAKLPLIVPVVLHHSKTGWRAATRFEEMLELDDTLRDVAGDLMLRFGIVLEDISHADDAALARPTMTDLGQLALHLFRHARFVDDLVQQFTACAGKVRAVALTPDGPRALLAVVEYLEGVTKRSRGEVVMAMRDALGWDPADKIIHVEEYIHEQGRLAGQQELLKSLLERRFGEVPEAAAKHIKVASFPEIEAMTERLLRATTIDEVLGKKRQRKAPRKAATSAPRRR